jgi:hypothetical protein
LILHAGVLALLVGGIVVVAMMAVGSALGVEILRRWDRESSSEEQLALERRTFLISALVGAALWIEVGSALLFIHTADDLHELFVGAMCATGSLNANPIGWWVLATKSALILLVPIWLALNRLDQRAGDYPVVRLKYGALLALTPLTIADLVLQLLYFGGIRPDIITSCCGSLFSESSDRVTGDLASLPAVPTLWVFVGGSAVFVAILGWARFRGGAAATGIAAGLTPLMLVLGLVSILSFVSVAYYELPTHHCPFDLFQGDHGYVGYALVISLVAAFVWGVVPGLFRPIARHPSLTALFSTLEKRWLSLALAAYVVFVAVALWPLVFGSLSLELM